MRRIALWVVRLEWPILVILTPLLLFPNTKRLLALLAIPLVWVARKIARGHFVRRTPLDWAMALLMFMVLVSLYATYSIPTSLPRITGVLLGIAIYYAVVEAVQSQTALRWASAGYLAAGAGVAGLAAVGMAKIYKTPILGYIVDRLPLLVRGLSENPEGLHPNIVAGTLLWFIPLELTVAVWLWRTRAGWLYQKWVAILASASVLGVLGVFVLTQSRGGWIGLGIGLLLLLASTGRPGKIAAGVVVVAVVATLALIGPEQIGQVLIAANADAAQSLSVDTLKGRVELWSRALYAIQDFPFTGMGMGTFGYIVPVLYPLFLVGPDVIILHAHDEFLQAAVDLGLPGLVAFLAIYGLTGWMLITVLRRKANSFSCAMTWGALIGLTAHACYGLTDAVLLGAKPSLFWWALLGLAAATFMLADRGDAESVCG